MRAVVYRGDQDVRVEEVPDPELLEPTDAVVRVHRAAICGSDLHIYNGRVPGVFEGATLGHEYTGEVVAVGDAVTGVQVGDLVVGSFQVVDGHCPACRVGRYNHCEQLAVHGYGVFVGDLGGAQAELVRVPYAAVNLKRIPDGVSEEAALFVGDILTTGWYAARGGEVGPGDTVLVVGAGPVGLFTTMAAYAQGAQRVIVTDLVAARLEAAAALGAETVDGSQRSVSVAVDELCPGGAPVVVETVGLVPALLTAIDVTRSGGLLSVIGVHTEFEAVLPLATLFTRNLTLRFGGSCNVQGLWDETMAAVVDGRLDPTRIVSHRLPLADAAEGYRLFEAKQALKVVLDVS